MKPPSAEATEGVIVDHKWVDFPYSVQSMTKEKESFGLQELDLKLTPGTLFDEN